MIRRITKHLGLLTIAVGAFMVSVPALAYVDTSPGSGASSSCSTAQPGQTCTVTATFTDLAPGTAVNFSATAGASACTVSLNPTSTTLNSSQQASTQATFSSGCAGTNATVTATGPQGQTVSATVAVAGGFPNTSAASIPVGWIVMALGALLILIGLVGVAWRRQGGAAAA